MRYFIVGLIVGLVVMVSAQQESPFSADLAELTTENIDSLALITAYDRETRQISVSPNGEMVAVATHFGDLDYSIIVSSVTSGDRIMVIVGRMDFFRELIWSPDSHYIATISERTTGGGVQLRSVKIYTVGETDTPSTYDFGNADVIFDDQINPVPFSDFIDSPVELSWSPSSDMIAVAFYDRLAILSVNQEDELYSAELPGIAHVEWDSNGRGIITENSDGCVQFWGVPVN